MINSEGFKYNHDQVWDMKINAFMDSVKRIGKIKNADLLLQSGYSGFGVNLKDIDGYTVIGGYAYSNQPTWVQIVSELFPGNIGYKCVVTGPAIIAGTVIYLKNN